MKIFLLIISCLFALTWWPEKIPATKFSDGSVLSPDQQMAQAVLEEVNTLRATGCKCPNGRRFKPAPALHWNEELEKAAQGHADDMYTRRYFNHTSPEGISFTKRIEQAGYRWQVVGENIAMGYPTPEAVVNAWRNSKDHCPNLMNPEFRDMGIGKSGAYWVQDLGAKGE